MRIIAGTHRGHRIAAPAGRETRPTSDRVRENAFNLIGPVDDADVLDLFAGSGAMGLEALSRGAASATFVESNRDACRTIGANLEKLRRRGATHLVFYEGTQWWLDYYKEFAEHLATRATLVEQTPEFTIYRLSAP
jgi:16S rRNA (guanine(966)-N(2))-methyltransferase RsmD